MTGVDRNLIAYHEAGHAVMALALDVAVLRVTIDPVVGSHDELGWTSRPEGPAKSEALQHAGDDSATWRRLLMDVAGPVAQVMAEPLSPYYGRPTIAWNGEWQESWSDDYEDAIECCNALNRQSPEDALHQAETAAFAILCAWWPRVEEIAERLLREAVVELVTDEMSIAVGNRLALHASLGNIATLAGGWLAENSEAQGDPEEAERLAALAPELLELILNNVAEALHDDGGDFMDEVRASVQRIADSRRLH